MAELIIPNTFVNETNIDALDMNANFNEIETFMNGEVIHRDGSVAMTGDLVLAGSPDTASSAANRAYVDQAEADAISTAAADATSKANAAQAAAIAAAAADATTKANAATAGYAATGWTNLSYLNGWNTFSGRQRAQYRKRFDEVQVRGNIQGGTSTSGIQVFTLPAGFRPPVETTVPVTAARVAEGTAGSPRMVIETDGSCHLFGCQTASANLDVAFYFTFSTTA